MKIKEYGINLMNKSGNPVFNMQAALPSSRKRRPNFASIEVKALIDGVKKRRNVALTKTQVPQPHKEAKEMAWDEITNAVNQVSVVRREKEEVRRRWNVLRSTVLKKKHLISRKAVGSEATLQLTSDEEAVLEILEQLHSASPPQKDDDEEASMKTNSDCSYKFTIHSGITGTEDAGEISLNIPPVLSQGVTKSVKDEDSGKTSQNISSVLCEDYSHSDTITSTKSDDAGEISSNTHLILCDDCRHNITISSVEAENDGRVSQKSLLILSKYCDSDNSMSPLEAGDARETLQNTPSMLCKDYSQNDTLSSAKADGAGKISSNNPFLLCEDSSPNVTKRSAKAASTQKQDNVASLQSSLLELKDKQEQIADTLEEVTNLMQEGLKEFHGISATLNKLFDC